MSNGAADQASIDIGEFERRLRSPAPRPAGDPLAQLARLVTPADGQPALDKIFAHSSKIAPAADSADLPQDFQTTALRGPVHDNEVFSRPLYARPAEAEHDAEMPAQDGLVQEGTAQEGLAQEQWAHEGGYEQMVPPEGRPRSRRPLYAAAAVIAVGMLGVGSTFAFKSQRAGSGELVEVKAAPGPTKVQTQASDASRASADATVLDKGVPAVPVTRVVDRQERPVDLKDAVAKAPRVVSTAPTSSTQMAGLASAAASSDNAVSGSFAQPRKVKTVSVRPDGSIVGGPTLAMPPTDAPPPTAATAPSGVAKSATPKVVARVATTPKPAADKVEVATKQTPAKADAVKSTTPKQVAAKPTRVARAADADADGDTDATPVATASRSSAGGGGFAVQLAAPGSEAEAKSAASRLSQKYSGQLGGARITVQKASDKEVYRVRTAGMSREDAVAACEKVKAAGGGCFVAKN